MTYLTMVAGCLVSAVVSGVVDRVPTLWVVSDTLVSFICAGAAMIPHHATLPRSARIILRLAYTAVAAFAIVATFTPNERAFVILDIAVIAAMSMAIIFDSGHGRPRKGHS
jgi:hypothetical protein